MPKIKPNEKCPCDSGIKYKKCCSKADQQEKLRQVKEFADLLLHTEQKSIQSEGLQRLNTYFLDRYKIPSIDLTDVVTGFNLKKVHGNYASKNMFLLVERNDNNDSAFLSKGAKTLGTTESGVEDTMVIYKNNFLLYHSDTEHDDAIEKIHEWFKSKRR